MMTTTINSSLFFMNYVILIFLFFAFYFLNDDFSLHYVLDDFFQIKHYVLF
jgi:hypothetical protein